ncbi:hypothetical protein M3J09_002883 [Ascochyta lentis]
MRQLLKDKGSSQRQLPFCPQPPQTTTSRRTCRHVPSTNCHMGRRASLQL